MLSRTRLIGPNLYNFVVASERTLTDFQHFQQNAVEIL